MGRKVLDEINLEQPLESIFYQNVQDTINKYWIEYEKILSHYVAEAAKIGIIHYDILLEASNDKADKFQAVKSRDTVNTYLNNSLTLTDEKELFMPNPEVETKLQRHTFEASEKTRKRVTNEINDILAEGYREGWGPRYVGDKIKQRFTDLKTYEARRIAQTEINTTRNYVQYSQLQADNMEYKIWHAAHDSRTRKSHLKVDEEIVPINERFSNGLMYPGDKDGPIEEWVNCRCSHAAYIIPLGFEAPDFFPFKEKDLIKVGSSLSRDYVEDIQQRIRLMDGAIVEEQRETEIEKPIIVERPKITPKPKKPKTEETVNVESQAKAIELQNQFNKDFYKILYQAEGTGGVELKPVYNKLKKKYKSKVKGRAEFEKLFANALQTTNTRLYPARDPELKVIFGKGKDARGFGYVDRSKMKKPKVKKQD